MAVERAAATGLRRHVCDFVSAHAAIEQASNSYDLRDRIIGVAMTSARHVGDPGLAADVLAELARLRFFQDRFAEARQIFGEALGRYRDLHDVRGQAASLTMHSYAVRAHAKAQMRMGRSAEALPRLEAALATVRGKDDRWGQAITLRVLGQLHLAEGRLDLAQDYLDAAMSIWDAMETPLWRARTEYDLALLHRRRGDAEAADTAFTHARSVFHERGAREYTEHVELPV
ncbi:tetratricopeptide repeat protein [Lentzea sp.]|uniref:tetratricopeptide repeat protein n=1 Tax=Lentzea sp. TaxID=56099 RepID=UPI002B8696AD|nr:tetratricopeptide repeat protein [Lentzea sp.]HUQ58813.1 tetratricopeptide repeat protein [Lentzea sp.]